MTHEYVANLHTHSVYSDGYGTHDEIAVAAIQAGLDLVAVTDHNVLVQGLDGYRYLGDKRVLLVAGEEIHDPAREPQQNHMLVYECGDELASFAPEPIRLIKQIQAHGGLSFIAHPHDRSAPAFDEPALPWVDWELQGFNGIEIWNFMSEFKGLLSSRLRALYYAHRFPAVARAPYPETLAKWDSLLARGQRIVALGSSDAHAIPARLGPIRKVLFPYEWLFQAVNTHLLLQEPLSGEAESDRQALFEALRRGHCFIGYDLPHPTRGFRFTAQGDRGQAMMGDILVVRYGASLQIKSPQRASIRLIKDGRLARSWRDQETAVLKVTEDGAYRVEVHLDLGGREQAWIFSNPIYLRLL